MEALPMFPPVHLELILQFLPMSEIRQMQSSSESLSRDARRHFQVRCQALLQTVPIAAQAHYLQLFETETQISQTLDDTASVSVHILSMRRLLLQVDEATQFGQWRTQTAVARLMTGVSLDGTDLFAAVKRAYLASQVPALAKNKNVVLWMHVLGALEEQDPIQSKVLAAEAWEALASQLHDHLDHKVRGVKHGNDLIPEAAFPSLLLLWMQTVHFVNALDDRVEMWVNSNCTARQQLQLYRGLQTLEQHLDQAPMLGRYGPSGDSSQLRSRHIAKIHERMRGEIHEIHF